MEKKKLYNLEFLKNNLTKFNNILNSNYLKTEKELFYDFKDIVFDLNDNISELNFILNAYDFCSIKDTLKFLEEKKKQLQIFLELKKKSIENKIIIEFESQLFELEIKHQEIVSFVIEKLSKKEEIFSITLTHVENFFENFGFSDFFSIVFSIIMEDFKISLSKYIKTKEYKFFEKERDFIDLQKNICIYLKYLNKILQTKKQEVFLKLLKNEIALVDLQKFEEKEDIERLFLNFQEKHYYELCEIVQEKNTKISMEESFYILFEQIIVFKLKDEMKKKGIFLILKTHILNFNLLIQKLFVEEDVLCTTAEFGILEKTLYLKNKYFMELNFLIKNLSVEYTKELQEFLNEEKKKLLDKKSVENFELKFIEIQIEQFVILEKAIKTKKLEINRNFVSFEIYLEIRKNEKKIFGSLIEFINILDLIKNLGTIQTKQEYLNFEKHKFKLMENLDRWKTIWKLKEIESFQKIVSDILSNTAESLESEDLLDQLFFKTTKKHFETIFEELKTGEEEKKYLYIDFSYIEHFLDEFLILKSIMLK